MSPDHATPGNGLLLFFRVDDFDLVFCHAPACGEAADLLAGGVAQAGEMFQHLRMCQDTLRRP